MKPKPLEDPFVRMCMFPGLVIGVLTTIACVVFYGPLCGLVMAIAYAWGNWSLIVGYRLGWVARSATPASNPE